MLCQKCNHNNATIHFEQNINGKVTTLDLCPDCAREMNLAIPQLTANMGSLFDGFGFGSMLGDMGSLSSFFDSPSQGIPSLSCKSCGTGLSDLKNTSFLGCPDCYGVFESLVENNLSRFQRGTRHTGKRPGRFGGSVKPEEEAVSDSAGAAKKPKSEKARLKAELKKAVKEENYERAAELRDKIKELE